MRGGQRKKPYVVGLRSSLEASLSESMCEDIVVSEECCKSIVEDKACNIKALVVALLSLFLIQKCSLFTYLICVNIN